jgi:hypothetical protein
MRYIVGNKTKVTKRTNTRSEGGGSEQYVTTVPKDIAEFLDLEGKMLEWKRGKEQNEIEVIIHDE